MSTTHHQPSTARHRAGVHRRPGRSVGRSGTDRRRSIAYVGSQRAGKTPGARRRGGRRRRRSGPARVRRRSRPPADVRGGAPPGAAAELRIARRDRPTCSLEWRERNPTATRVLGLGWMFSAVPDGTPTRQMLDAIVADVPVYLSASDLHSVWINSAGLDELGIDDDDPDPIGGRIVRDEDGSATGLLLETAAIELAWPVTNRATDDRARPLRASDRRRLSRVGDDGGRRHGARRRRARRPACGPMSAASCRSPSSATGTSTASDTRPRRSPRCSPAAEHAARHAVGPGQGRRDQADPRRHDRRLHRRPARPLRAPRDRTRRRRPCRPAS